MKTGKFFYSAKIKTYHWDPDKNKVEVDLIRVEKRWPEEDIKKYKKDYLITILFASLLLGSLGGVGFAFNLLTGLIGTLSLFFFTLTIGFIKYLTAIQKDYHYDLGYEDGWREDCKLKDIFSEEIEEENIHRIKEEAKAKRWRKKNPLEELIRKSLETKDSKIIAELIRYCIDVKEEVVPQDLEEDKDKIIVKYLDNK